MSYFSSIQRSAPVVTNLIIINVLVWVAQGLFKDFNLTELGSLHYYKSDAFKPYQMVTSMFMHDPRGFTHILFNMFGLFMFGSVLERFWGSKKFLLFYLVCGIGASIVIQFTVPYSAEKFANHPFGIENAAEVTWQQLYDFYLNYYSALGASGAIMGIMAAFAYLFPNTELVLLFLPVPIKAKYMIPIFLLIDLFGGIYQFKGDNIGHFAHLGGALIGFLLVLYWTKFNRKSFY